MNKRFFYRIVNLLSLLTAVAAGVFVVLAVIGSLTEKNLQWTPLISALRLVITSVLLYAVWDIGTRLHNVEVTQSRLAKDVGRRGDDESGD